MVRDPFTRLLSFYRNKHEQQVRFWALEGTVKLLTSYRPIRWTGDPNFDKVEEASKAVKYAIAMTEKKPIRKPPVLADNPYLTPPYPTLQEMVYAVIAGYWDPHVIPGSQFCGPCNETE